MGFLSKLGKALGYGNELQQHGASLLAAASPAAGLIMPRLASGSTGAVPPAPTPGVTDSDVLAADLRLRRRMALGGRGSTQVSGGLAGTTPRLTMPTLVGV